MNKNFLRTDSMQCLDAACDKTSAALAIIDCVRVLCSLERAPEGRGEGLSTGHGFAAGDTTRDVSMALALYHAMGLVQDVGSAAESAFRQLMERERKMDRDKSQP